MIQKTHPVSEICLRTFDQLFLMAMSTTSDFNNSQSSLFFWSMSIYQAERITLRPPNRQSNVLLAMSDNFLSPGLVRVNQQTTNLSLSLYSGRGKSPREISYFSLHPM